MDLSGEIVEGAFALLQQIHAAETDFLLYVNRTAYDEKQVHRRIALRTDLRSRL